MQVVMQRFCNRFGIARPLASSRGFEVVVHPSLEGALPQPGAVGTTLGDANWFCIARRFRRIDCAHIEYPALSGRILRKEPNRLHSLLASPSLLSDHLKCDTTERSDNHCVGGSIHGLPVDHNLLGRSPTEVSNPHLSAREEGYYFTTNAFSSNLEFFYG